MHEPPALLPLCDYRAVAGRPTMVADTPVGRRIIVPVLESQWKGERFDAVQKEGSSGDSIILGPDGTAMIDVRMVLKTHDGALVLASYQGRADWSAGTGTQPVRIAVKFETQDERYRWLNTAIAIGKGVFDGETITYPLFEVG